MDGSDGTKYGIDMKIDSMIILYISLKTWLTTLILQLIC